ncbi:hypothetical protein RFI_22677 [Reticulomyxa filosa]|uniref:Uncharacterized protein n=1 Tax=Reticulomyxa filosa TaxID=46433 RepID=X6MM05_RETFI|nr:hypothetical protein RFI_22677 [Reticulomyxa filosa]|eukprot:ETO14691.1 hypothetical protein RFI_22677 [Reticulomyxa filosa]
MKEFINNNNNKSNGNGNNNDNGDDSKETYCYEEELEIKRIEEEIERRRLKKERKDYLRNKRKMESIRSWKKIIYYLNRDEVPTTKEGKYIYIFLLNKNEMFVCLYINAQIYSSPNNEGMDGQDSSNIIKYICVCLLYGACIIIDLCWLLGHNKHNWSSCQMAMTKIIVAAYMAKWRLIVCQLLWMYGVELAEDNISNPDYEFICYYNNNKTAYDYGRLKCAYTHLIYLPNPFCELLVFGLLLRSKSKKSTKRKTFFIQNQQSSNAKFSFLQTFFRKEYYQKERTNGRRDKGQEYNIKCGKKFDKMKNELKCVSVHLGIDKNKSNDLWPTKFKSEMQVSTTTMV